MFQSLCGFPGFSREACVFFSSKVRKQAQSGNKYVLERARDTFRDFMDVLDRLKPLRRILFRSGTGFSIEK